MKFVNLAGAAALALTLVPAVALADDPNDPTMRNAVARGRDKAMIRQLNLQQLAKVRARDAKLAPQWQAYRDYHDGGRGRADAYERDRADYQDARADYAQRMAEWRHAVAMCNSGHWEYCDD